MKVSGRVYLVGAGPGAPDLLTIRAARLLERADIVFYDALVHPQTLQLAASARKVAVGKRCGRHSTAQHFINKQLIDAARTHATIVRLKGGDPMIFGRSQEEIDALETAGIDVEVVPGITAAFAAAAQLRVSLTQRGESRSVTFATPRVGVGRAPSDWSAALDPAETSAIYMGAQQAEQVREALTTRGFHPETPAVIVESASLPNTRILSGPLRRLSAMCAQVGSGPAVILVGNGLKRARTADADQPPATLPARQLTAG